MTQESVARRVDESAAKHPPSTRERCLRGYALWGSPLGRQIEHRGKGVYSVPSCSGEGTYEVDLKVFTDEPETCNCPDHARHPEYSCKHIICATIFRAKRRAAAHREQAERTAARASAANLASLAAL